MLLLITGTINLGLPLEAIAQGKWVSTDALSIANNRLIQDYGFSSKDIADALITAKNRGVNVKVILDKSQRSQKYSLLHYIVDAGIPVWIDMKPTIAYNKVMIIDGKEVVTGSFNFTDAAQKRNAENVVFISDSKLAKGYNSDRVIDGLTGGLLHKFESMLL